MYQLHAYKVFSPNGRLHSTSRLESREVDIEGAGQILDISPLVCGGNSIESLVGGTRSRELVIGSMLILLELILLWFGVVGRPEPTAFTWSSHVESEYV
jgi:hypothetical protein